MKLTCQIQEVKDQAMRGQVLSCSLHCRRKGGHQAQQALLILTCKQVQGGVLHRGLKQMPWFPGLAA